MYTLDVYVDKVVQGLTNSPLFCRFVSYLGQFYSVKCPRCVMCVTLRGNGVSDFHSGDSACIDIQRSAVSPVL